MKSKLIGKKVYITDPESIYHGEWGEIMDYDGEVYHIAIAQGKTWVIFDRDQFRVPRKWTGA
jgi:ribosomal protein L21E